MPNPEDSKPIDKIPYCVEMKMVNEIPDNAQFDFLCGFYEIVSFFCQKKFKNDVNYKTVLEMKSKLEQKFPRLK